MNIHRNILLIATCSMFSCTHASQNAPLVVTQTEALPQVKDEQASVEQMLKKQEAMMQLTGTVNYMDFEGGFYGFVAKDGKKYTLSKLPKEFRKHGLVIEITAEPMEAMATTTQFGSLLKVHSLKMIDDSQVKPIRQDNTM